MWGLPLIHVGHYANRIFGILESKSSDKKDCSSLSLGHVLSLFLIQWQISGWTFLQKGSYKQKLKVPLASWTGCLLDRRLLKELEGWWWAVCFCNTDNYFQNFLFHDISLKAYLILYAIRNGKGSWNKVSCLKQGGEMKKFCLKKTGRAFEGYGCTLPKLPLSQPFRAGTTWLFFILAWTWFKRNLITLKRIFLPWCSVWLLYC